MPQYLVSCLYDEGIYTTNFVVVEAKSQLEIAAHMISNSQQWEHFLTRAFAQTKLGFFKEFGYLWDCVQQPDITPERLLELIAMTSVDGDSTAQLAIHEITVQSLSQVDTKPDFSK
ncbi:MAG: hypothetical protein ICV85_12320 [Tolypothrix sp. T3-bin4]|nr:hypothetical protein [Tolypothrix sp. Co-bin9]MBD0302920.1 hypothetical protein [Tolypothrix sp. T3-bin4]